VLSSTNTGKEMCAKRQLYFEKGALEVWLCDVDGRLTFFDPHGPLEKSILFPDFPTQIEH
jgi:hypothetical protein